MFRDLILGNRSYRRFDAAHRISRKTLEELADLGRLSPSAANRQPIKYFLSADDKTNKKIFPTLMWAGYLKDWNGPDTEERPSGYIIILGDTNISPKIAWDHGIVAQGILLGAVEKGLGGCMFASINREQLRKNIGLADHLEILLVVALGKPIEKVVIDEIEEDGSIKYWRDDDKVHHVPKRKLSDILIN